MLVFLELIVGLHLCGLELLSLTTRQCGMMVHHGHFHIGRLINQILQMLAFGGRLVMVVDGVQETVQYPVWFFVSGTPLAVSTGNFLCVRLWG